MRLGCSVVAFDGPAHGDTPSDETSPRPFRAAINAVGEQLGPLRAVIAHSAGGLGALPAITSGLRTERLVLLAAPASRPIRPGRSVVWVGQTPPLKMLRSSVET